MTLAHLATCALRFNALTSVAASVYAIARIGVDFSNPYSILGENLLLNLVGPGLDLLVAGIVWIYSTEIARWIVQRAATPVAVAIALMGTIVAINRGCGLVQTVLSRINLPDGPARETAALFVVPVEYLWASALAVAISISLVLLAPRISLMERRSELRAEE